MKKFDIPITVALNIWNTEDTIRKTVESIVDLADFVVIVYGRLPSDQEKNDNTLKILQQLQIDYPDLITVIAMNQWTNEVEKLNTTWYEAMGYYFLLHANEFLDDKIKKELLDAIPKSIEQDTPIIAKTTNSDTYKFRGCQVDFAKHFYTPGIPPEPFSNNRVIQLKCPISVRQ